MYTDPTQRHTLVVKVRLNDEELALLRAAAHVRALQPAAAAREFALESIVKKFCSVSNVNASQVS
jgi:hypothetical protein